MKEQNQERMKAIITEIRTAYNHFDDNIDLELPVVPIQDLEYWQAELSEVLSEESREVNENGE